MRQHPVPFQQEQDLQKSDQEGGAGKNATAWIQSGMVCNIVYGAIECHLLVHFQVEILADKPLNRSRVLGQCFDPDTPKNGWCGTCDFDAKQGQNGYCGINATNTEAEAANVSKYQL